MPVDPCAAKAYVLQRLPQLPLQHRRAAIPSKGLQERLVVQAQAMPQRRREGAMPATLEAIDGKAHMAF